MHGKTAMVRALYARMYRQHWWQFWKPKAPHVFIDVSLPVVEPKMLLGNPFSREN